MSVEEIKATVDKATPTERRVMAAYLKLKSQQEGGKLGKELGMTKTGQAAGACCPNRHRD